MEPKIEFEITNAHIPYRYISKLIKKICEEHEGKRDLHIKVNLIENYLEESETSIEESVTEVATAPNKMVTLAGANDGGWIIVEENKSSTEIQLEEFEKLCAPLVEFIRKKYTAQARIIVEWDRASLVTDVLGAPFQAPD